MILEKLLNMFSSNGIINKERYETYRERKHKEELERAAKVQERLEREMERRIELLQAEIRAENIRNYREQY